VSFDIGLAVQGF